MPHSAVNNEHLVFLRSNDEHSPWEVLEGAGSFKDGLGKLEVTSFSLFSRACDVPYLCSRQRHTNEWEQVHR